MKTRIILIFALGVLCAGCDRGTGSPQESEFTVRGDTVHIGSDGKIISRLTFENIYMDTVAVHIETAGTIQAIPTNFAYVAPPFSGRIIRSYVQLGQRVSAGTPLFDIISPEFTEVQKEFFQARADLDLARLDMQRKKGLLDNGVGSQREYEEAANALLVAEKEYENSVSALEIYHVKPEEMVLGQPLTVRSPIRGNVIENNIVTGQYLSADAEPVASIGNLEKVWVMAQVKEKDIRFLSEGDPIKVVVSAYPGEVIEGEVFHIDEAVDEETRSIRVLSVCDNSDEKLKIGMYATVGFSGTAEVFAVVPDKAIMQGEQNSYMFVRHDRNTLLRRPADVAFTADGKAYLRGEAAGADVVSSGAFYLTH